jgi:hypothetical protein
MVMDMIEVLSVALNGNQVSGQILSNVNKWSALTEILNQELNTPIPHDEFLIRTTLILESG